MTRRRDEVTSMLRCLKAIRFLPLLLAAMACVLTPAVGAGPTATALPAATERPTATPPFATTSDEPVLISGSIPFTSPFFLDGIAEPFVLLEDETGFIHRDKQFVFPLASQTIGPVELVQDGLLNYTLSLPARPQGTLNDVDNNGRSDPGVMVFAIAYWSNTWGDTFLEARDGRGWSNAYTSAHTDPYQEDEIDGGTLLIWAPDGDQAFPTDFGPDGLLFTGDDPTAPIPAGYSLVDLGQTPFRIYKEPTPQIDLLEGVVAVTDYSTQSPADAFDSLLEKVSREYPFTADKGVDWESLRSEFVPRVRQARTREAFYRAIKAFTLEIPDEHIGLSFNSDVFYQDWGGSYGLVLSELSDGRVIARQVIPSTPAAQAGLRPGAEIQSWNGVPIAQAAAQVVPFLGPYSTEQAARPMRLVFLTRGPIGTPASVGYTNPGGSPQTADLVAVQEYDSLFAALPGLNHDALMLPIEARVLDSGIGYIQITTFSDDYNLMAHLWQYHMKQMVDAKVPALIIDVRDNGGGSGGLALDFAGYFYDEAINLSVRKYYNEETGAFESRGEPERIEPGPVYFDGPVALLISPDCVSACEGFTYAMSQGGRSTLVGHAPTAGAYGEVGRGQYKLPDDLTLQFPTGRPETLDGKLLIEGTGLAPDLLVPVTYDSAMGRTDAVLDAAVGALLDELGR
jgi:C-terminal processing protease CtpA/Prc